MTEHVRRWSLTVPRPTVVLRATCSPGEAVRALAHALTAEGFRIKHSATPLHLEARRINWWYLATGWPEKAVVIADGVPTADGCELRVHHPSGNEDITAGSRAVRTLERTVAALRASGAQVVVGEWESGLRPRRPHAK